MTFSPLARELMSRRHEAQEQQIQQAEEQIQIKQERLLLMLRKAYYSLPSWDASSISSCVQYGDVPPRIESGRWKRAKVDQKEDV